VGFAYDTIQIMQINSKTKTPRDHSMYLKY
jgi:hypothetical protein